MPLRWRTEFRWAMGMGQDLEGTTDCWSFLVPIPLWGAIFDLESYPLFFWWTTLEDFSSLLIKLSFSSTRWSSPNSWYVQVENLNRWLRWFVAPNRNSARGVPALALHHRLLFCQWKQRCRATRWATGMATVIAASRRVSQKIAAQRKLLRWISTISMVGIGGWNELFDFQGIWD